MSQRQVKLRRKLMRAAGIPLGVDDMEWWTAFTTLLPVGDDIGSRRWRRTLEPYLESGRTRGKAPARDWRAKFRRSMADADVEQFETVEGTRVNTVPYDAFRFASTFLANQGL